MRNFYRRKKSTAPDTGSKSKYGNKKVEFMGIRFDSKKEMQRYVVLLEARDKGLISDLQLQPKFEIVPHVLEQEIVHLKTKDKVVDKVAQMAITYSGDFSYVKDGRLVVEDVKASAKFLDETFKLKEKLMYALKGIKIRRVYEPTEPI